MLTITYYTKLSITNIYRKTINMIINEVNFIKFIIDDNIFKLSFYHDNVVNYQALSLRNIVVLSDNFLEDKYFDLTEGALNVNIPLVLFKLQIAMKNTTNWTFDIEKNIVENGAKKIISDYVDARSEGKGICRFSNEGNYFFRSVLEINPEQFQMTYYYSNDETKSITLLTQDAAFDVPIKLFYDLFDSLCKKTNIEATLNSHDDMIKFIRRIIENVFILRVDILPYDNNNRAFMLYNLDAPNTENAQYWLTGKKPTIEYSIIVMNIANKLNRIGASIEFKNKITLDDEFISMIEIMNSYSDKLSKKALSLY